MNALLFSSRTKVTTIALAAILSVVSPISPTYAQEGKATTAAEQSVYHNRPDSFAELAKKVLPAVVNISTTQRAMDATTRPNMDIPEFPPGSPFEDFFEDFMGQQPNPEEGLPYGGRPQSLGSGFIIDAEKGLVVTNNHVVEQAEEIQVILHDDTKIEAAIIGRDEKTDLALLKIETDHPLNAVPWGNSKKMNVGDWVLAVGNPFGLGGTVTAGIISARQRNINAGPYDDFIQTDASINRGNSGGPMFNTDGEVIGINTAIFSPTGGSVGIGFAIPSDLANNVIDQLVQYGETRRGWLGVRIQTITDEIAESLGLENTNGALVASITPEGPADKAGLKAGDIIRSFDDKEVDEMRHLPRIVAETPIGKEVNIGILRQGKDITKKVTIAQLEKAEKEGLLEKDEIANRDKKKAETEFDDLGLAVAPLTDTLKKQYGIASNVAGLLITDVDRTSNAAEKGVRKGDVIQEANQQVIESVSTFTSIVKKAKSEGKSSVLLLINNRGDLRFVAVKFAKEKKDN